MGQKYFPVAFKSKDVRSGDATCLRMCLCQLDIKILCQLDHNVGPGKYPGLNKVANNWE